MSETRTLPIPAEHREFTVKVNGEALGREHPLLMVSVQHRANHISSARLVYQDGGAASSDFPLSDGALFIPGAEIEILAGAGNDPVSIFKGIVIQQQLKVREHTGPQLIVECRHKAVTLTAGRKNACFLDQTDSDIIGAIFSQAQLDAQVDATAINHAQLVQFNATDWDFCLMRAQANGLVVWTDSDRILVTKPDLGGSASTTLQFGATVLEMDIKLDSRRQYAAVKASTWDAGTQSVIEKDAADPGLGSPGNLSGSDLSAALELDHFSLRHPHLAEDEAQSWADAQWRYAQLNRVTGRVKCEGIATLKAGDMVGLGGMGDRFNGNAHITAVRHDVDLVQGWKTHLQLGGVEWLGETTPEPSIEAPRAAGLLPGVSGLQIGIVVSNEDPDGEYRVRVKLPLVDNDSDGVWARVASLDAGNARGFCLRPEIGDEVALGFLGGDPRTPVILGMLHSSALPAPLSGSDDNHEKVFQSRSKMRWYLNDEKKIMQFDTPAGNRLSLSEDDKAITLADQHGNTIVMNQDGIRIESSKALTLKAATEVKLESGTALAIKGGTEAKMEGASGAEVTSTGTTRLKGGMVQIN